MRTERANTEAVRVDAELLFRHDGQMPQIRWKTEDDIHAPGLGDLNLATRRRRRAAAGHDGYGAGVAPQGFARRDPAVTEPKRVGDHYHVARPHALQGEAAAAEDRHDLAILRRVEHRPRQARRAAARLQHQRHALAIGGRDTHEVAEGRVALDALAQLFHRVGRKLGQINEPMDIAWLEADAAPMPLEKRNLPPALDRRQEARFLTLAQLVAGNAKDLVEVIRRRREVPRQRIEIERAPIPGAVVLVIHALQVRVAPRPPSTWKVAPVMYAPHGETRNATRPAISSGVPRRPSGIDLLISARARSSSAGAPAPEPKTFSSRPVAMRPGQTVFTVIFSAASSIESVFA